MKCIQLTVLHQHSGHRVCEHLHQGDSVRKGSKYALLDEIISGGFPNKNSWKVTCCLYIPVSKRMRDTSGSFCCCCCCCCCCRRCRCCLSLEPGSESENVIWEQGFLSVSKRIIVYCICENTFKRKTWTMLNSVNKIWGQGPSFCEQAYHSILYVKTLVNEEHWMWKCVWTNYRTRSLSCEPVQCIGFMNTSRQTTPNVIVSVNKLSGNVSFRWASE